MPEQSREGRGEGTGQQAIHDFRAIRKIVMAAKSPT